MAIQRWEMLLSAQADCYLLKIQGDRVDVDRILQAHPQSCQSVQEISGDVFQWVIFVVDAPLSERLSIQNQVMSLTNETAGGKPSEELLGILDGLSNALQDLTNLTDDEQAFVLNKMARMGSAPPPAPTTTGYPPPIQTPGRAPTPPGAYPPAGSPLPRVTIPGRPGTPLPPKMPGGVPGAPMMPPAQPGKPGAGTPLPSPGPIPGIVRPVMPPKTFPGAPQVPPKLPGVPMPTPMPSVQMPKITPPPPPKIVAPPAPPPPVIPPPPIPVPPPVPAPLPPKQIKEAPVEMKKMDILETVISELKTELPKPVESAKVPLVEPLAFTPPPLSKPPEPVTTQEMIAPIPAKKGEPVAPPPVAAPTASAPPPPKTTEETTNLRISIFFQTGQESVMNLFLSTLTDVAQKKSKRPTAFQVATPVPTEVTIENSTEWIWTAKTSGSDIFIVILPEGMGSEIMDPLVGEALSAGLRCFIVPQAEVSSKLLYMDLMVELMMFKRRIRPTSS